MLISLYSETGLLRKNIQFKAGINIILGKYSGDKNTLGINGIGKSTLIRLIDYTLLSEKAEKIFSQAKFNFLREENHSITLEFEFLGKNYFIKRSFIAKSPIHFGTQKKSFDQYEKTELKSILFNIFFPIENNAVVVEGNRFRTLMNFFIKDDINHQKRFDPLNFTGVERISSKEIPVYNFFLLDLPTKPLQSFIEILKDYTDKRTTVKEIEKTIEKQTGKSIEEYKSEKILIEQKISTLELSLAEYKFVENYKNIENQLIEITGKINSKLENYHSDNRQLKRIQESYQMSVNIDIGLVQKLYNEVQDKFGDLVRKTLDEIIEFKSQLLENRSKFLFNKEKHLNERVSQTLIDISNLENERSKLYQMLKEKGALDSIENTYKTLISEKSMLQSIVIKTEQADDIKISTINLEQSLSNIRSEIVNLLTEYQSHIDVLRTLFLEILEKTLHISEEKKNAFFNISTDISTNKTQFPFKIQLEIPKIEALGQTRFKIIAYDLMVFLNKIRTGRNLPDFLIHDGVFHGIAKRTMVNAVNFMFRQFNQYHNFQYILTFNEDEIASLPERQDADGAFEFDLSQSVIAEFSDNEDSMIFKRILL